MEIRIAKKDDFEELANMKWEHLREDDVDYNENNLEGCNRNEFVKKFVQFLNNDTSYKIFVAVEDNVIVSSMFLCLIPKLPKPIQNSKYIGYLTNVYTKKEYRNKGIGTMLLEYIKNYAKKEESELLFVFPSDNSIKWYERNGFNKENEIYQATLNEE